MRAVFLYIVGGTITFGGWIHMHRHRFTGRQWLLIAMVVVLALGTAQTLCHVDSDSWFMVFTGRQILDGWKSGGFPSYPTQMSGTTHTGWATIVEQPWISLIKAMFYDMGNTGGLVILNIIMAVICIGSLYTWSYWRTKKRALSIFSASVPLVLVGGTYVLSGRPMAMSGALFVWLLWVLESAENLSGKEQSWRLMTVFIISAIWIRCHMALWWVGVGLCLIWTMSDASTRTWTPWVAWEGRRRFWCAFGLYLLGGLTTSYGLDASLFLFRAYGAASVIPISEMMQPDLLSDSMLVCLFGLIVEVWALFDGRMPMRDFILAGIGIVGGAMTCRNIFMAWICILPAFLFMACHIKLDRNVIAEKLHLPSVDMDKWDFDKSFGTALVILFIGITLSVSTVASVGIQTESDSNTPVEAAQEILHNAKDKEPRVLTSFNTGAYLMSQGCLVSMDARPELYGSAINRSDDYVKEYLKLLRGGASVYDQMTDQKCTYVCLDKSAETAAAYQIKHDSRFVILYEDGDTIAARISF